MELKYIDIGLNLMGKQFDSDRETGRNSHSTRRPGHELH